MDSMYSVAQLGGSSPPDDWENAFAPYDETTYATALDALHSDDIVLDIGAGDLRFARRAAERVQRVIAIEQRAELLNVRVPSNVEIICGDARVLEFPKQISTAVLLMRHCQHFALYRAKLERADCARLITNARWGMDVEVMNLRAPRQNYADVLCGWYACECGRVGFKFGTDCAVQNVTQVKFCPRCFSD